MSMRSDWLAGKLDTSPPSCPGCALSGSLTLLQRGRQTQVKGLQDSPDLWGCVKCGWEGWGIQDEPLGIKVQVLDPETGHVATPSGSEAERCFREQEHMQVARSGGGGSKGRRNPKPGDKELARRPEQEAPALTRERVKQAIDDSGRASILYKLPACSKAVLSRAAKERGLTVTEVINQALALWMDAHCILGG